MLQGGPPWTDERPDGVRRWAAPCSCSAVCAGSGQSPPPVSASMPDIGTAASTDPVHVVAAGDIACKPGARTTPRSCQAAATARLVTSLDPAAVIALGDLQYTSGSTEEFAGSYARTWEPSAASRARCPATTSTSPRGQSATSLTSANRSPGTPGTPDEWRIYQLNSELRQDVDCAAQVRWLERDLHPRTRGSAVPSSCTSPGTPPASSTGSDRVDDPVLARRLRAPRRPGPGRPRPRLRALRAHGQRSGHLLLARGITSFVAGAGGNSLYHHGTTVPGSQFYQASTFGVLDLQLRPGGFDWAFRTVARTTPDRGSARCV